MADSVDDVAGLEDIYLRCVLGDDDGDPPWCEERGSEIDRLRAEVKRLRDAIEEHRRAAGIAFNGTAIDEPRGYEHDHDLWHALAAAREEE